MGGGGGQETAPSDSRFERGGVEIAEQDRPLRLAFLAREGDEGQETAPSGSCFERGRGGEVVEDKTAPSGSRFEQGSGGGWLGTRDQPLLLAFRAREGDGEKRRPPPAHVSSEGQDGEVVEDKSAPSGSRFERGRGW